MVARPRRRRRGNPVVPRSTLRVARNHPVVTTVTARPAVARRWVHTTLWRHRRQHRYSADGDGLTVGLGVQWTPPFRKLPAGAEPRPGTLQLCVGNSCLVFKIAQAGGAVPRILRRFLADARVTFAAYNVASDCRKLRAHHGLDVASTLELRSAAGDGLGNAPMAEMASRLLGIPRGRVEKPRWIATSEWDGERLSWGQVRYAAADAYLSCRLGERIRRRRVVHAVESEDEYESSDDGDESGESREQEDADDDDDDDGRWTHRFVGFIGVGGGCVDDEDDMCLPYETPAFTLY